MVFSFSTVIALEISFEKIFQSVGKMAVSMFSMLCGCIANIILDPVLIFGLGPAPCLGIEGAALATGIGQCLTVLPGGTVAALCAPHRQGHAHQQIARQQHQRRQDVPAAHKARHADDADARDADGRNGVGIEHLQRLDVGRDE